MIPIYERRRTPGIAIVTERPAVQLKQKYQAVGISSGVYAVQEHNHWPPHRAPMVLDTIGLEPHMLIDLLVKPPAPFIAIADPADWRGLRLLGLCPAVLLICPDEPRKMRMWSEYLAYIVPAKTGAAWLFTPPATS